MTPVLFKKNIHSTVWTHIVATCPVRYAHFAKIVECMLETENCMPLVRYENILKLLENSFETTSTQLRNASRAVNR